MKIRNGFVSNSSSSSFAIPMEFLTKEQIEALLFIDDSKDVKKELSDIFKDDKFINPFETYPKNEEYHKIYYDMINNNEWWDSGWTTSIDEDKVMLGGGTLMWNGTIEKFMEKIGIDITALEIRSPGMVSMPTNPKALKIFAKKRKEAIKWFAELDEESIEKEYILLEGPIEDNPYELEDSEFSDFYGDLRYKSKDGYDYIKRIEK